MYSFYGAVGVRNYLSEALNDTKFGFNLDGRMQSTICTKLQCHDQHKYDFARSLVS